MRSSPAPVSMFLAGSEVSVPSAARSYCMNTRFQYSRYRSPPTTGPPAGPNDSPAVEVELGVRAAGARRAGLPEVVGLAEALDPLARHAHLHPALERLVVARHALHALEDRDPDLLGVEAEHLGGDLPPEADGVVLEVVADREVAEHLEEGEMPRGVPHLIDVVGAEALLRAGHPPRRRVARAEEVRLQRLHPGDREQHRRVVLERDERGRGDGEMALLLEVREEGRTDLVGGHPIDSSEAPDARLTHCGTRCAPRGRAPPRPARPRACRRRGPPGSAPGCARARA